jgi:hypothetical protein
VTASRQHSCKQRSRRERRPEPRASRGEHRRQEPHDPLRSRSDGLGTRIDKPRSLRACRTSPGLRGFRRGRIKHGPGTGDASNARDVARALVSGRARLFGACCRQPPFLIGQRTDPARATMPRSVTILETPTSGRSVNI